MQMDSIMLRDIISMGEQKPQLFKSIKHHKVIKTQILCTVSVVERCQCSFTARIRPIIQLEPIKLNKASQIVLLNERPGE